MTTDVSHLGFSGGGSWGGGTIAAVRGGLPSAHPTIITKYWW
jgi:hypothetical protein